MEYGLPRTDVEKAYSCKDYLESGFNSKVAIEALSSGLVSFEALMMPEQKWVKILDFKGLLKSEKAVPFFKKLDFEMSDQQDFEMLSVNNFYEDPDKVRELALSLDYEGESEWYKGYRTKERYMPKGTKERFEQLINKKITNWEHYMNGRFCWCGAETPVVYHSDTQTYAGAIYLTPGAPPDSGTSFWRSKAHPSLRKSTNVEDQRRIFPKGFFDKHQFELVDQVGNIYNRLVIWDGKSIHSATSYFGNTKENSRLFHLFFFDAE